MRLRNKKVTTEDDGDEISMRDVEFQKKCCRSASTNQSNGRKRRSDFLQPPLKRSKQSLSVQVPRFRPSAPKVQASKVSQVAQLPAADVLPKNVPGTSKNGKKAAIQPMRNSETPSSAESLSSSENSTDREKSPSLRRQLSRVAKLTAENRSKSCFVRVGRGKTSGMLHPLNVVRNLAKIAEANRKLQMGDRDKERSSSCESLSSAASVASDTKLSRRRKSRRVAEKVNPLKQVDDGYDPKSVPETTYIYKNAQIKQDTANSIQKTIRNLKMNVSKTAFARYNEVQEDLQNSFEERLSKNSMIHTIYFGNFAPVSADCCSRYPSEYALCESIYVCTGCFHYFDTREPFESHKNRCELIGQPMGDVVYKDPSRKISIFRVQPGEADDLYDYAYHLSLFGFIWIETKAVFESAYDFDYYVMFTQQINGKYQPMGFFSQLPENNHSENLSCICIFPWYRNLGLSTILIDFSYTMTRWACLIHGPERPFSTSGEAAYKSYWRKRFCFCLKKYALNKKVLSLEEISEKAGIKEVDLKLAIHKFYPKKSMNWNILKFDKSWMSRELSKYEPIKEEWVHPEFLKSFKPGGDHWMLHAYHWEDEDEDDISDEESA
ncbi:hypothetical protein WR25_08267 [Diploscapter pachys]|uniref:histone acetyltransferase n=1 Tax=Diploscapter pachys TaxID=2018661 RepID=A0A2A2LHI3_9BILA|nr:hypothetical protein WR25_08267 [Diploscapter pachys]